MTSESDSLPYPRSAPRYGGFSEDAAVEGPAIELFQSLGWSQANLYQETFGAGGTEGRATMREAVLPNRLWPALQKLNPHLPPEALRDAASEITRDRSAMLATDANAEIYRLLRDGVPVQTRGADGERKPTIFCSLDRSGFRANSTSAAPIWSVSSTDCRCCSSN